MQRPLLYALTSSLHGEMAPDPRQEPFVREVEAALGVPFDWRGDDFSRYGKAGVPEIIYVRTGGTEGLFLEKVAPLLPEAAAVDGRHPTLSLEGVPGANVTVRLLASGQSNSLAASMEILSWLRQRGIAGEILHGSPAQIAARLGVLPGAKAAISHPEAAKTVLPGAKAAPNAPGDTEPATPSVSWTEPLSPETFGPILAGKRFGVVGRPSDWLISSEVDYTTVRQTLGAELVDIPIAELVAEAAQGTWELPEGFRLNALNRPRYGHPISEADWSGALAIYGALQRLVRRYRLDGLTLRCFDLLTALHNTGCLALAILNAEGLTATCEGDIPAMLSMAVARALTGSASFQVNLSRIDGGQLLFAHCTVPLSIVRGYCYDTHFESGIGVAVHGELPEGPVTLFKLSPDLKRLFRCPARLLANSYGDNLCRTQVVIEAPGAADYFLREPLGNHHIIVPGTL